MGIMLQAVIVVPLVIGMLTGIFAVLGYFIIGFVISFKQSIRGNLKLNLQGLNKDEAIIKTVILIFKDWNSNNK